MSTDSLDTAAKNEAEAKQAAQADANRGLDASEGDDDNHGDYGGGDPDGSQPIHEYDDIKECDNLLPRWWLYTLYATIVFAFGYWFHYEVFKTGARQMDLYNEDVQAQAAAESARVRAAGVMTPAALLAFSRDAAIVSRGQQVFRTNCVTCHAANAGGLVGPNLTDEFWIHGGNPDQIYATITDGVRGRAMAAWGPQIGIENVQAVTAYLLTIRNTHVTGRPPEGERVQAQ
ncbi:MAG: cbb3-type cytochrome c oxidase N-terminal domain-containing protein [Deltaproteobacteria bacterium]